MPMAIIDSRGRPLSRAKKARAVGRGSRVPDDEQAVLVQILAAAVKADRKAFGRPDCARVAAAILPRLNATQIALLRDGACGETMARAVARIEQKPPQ
jgi:hypothetical protein